MIGYVRSLCRALLNAVVIYCEIAVGREEKIAFAVGYGVAAQGVILRLGVCVIAFEGDRFAIDKAVRGEREIGESRGNWSIIWGKI